MGADSCDGVLPELTVLAAAVSAEHGVSAALLEGYLPALLNVAVTGRRLSVDGRDACRTLGAEAVPTGVALPTVVDVYMTASRRLWSRLPEFISRSRGRPLRSGELLTIGDAVWRGADDALAALAEGYLHAQRLVVRREEASRRDLIDDLLAGDPDIGSLVEQAEPFGLSLGAAHIVAVAQTDRPVDAAARVTGWVDDAVRARFHRRGVLVADKDGRLVAVLSSSPPPDQSDAAAGQELASVLGPAAAQLVGRSGWRVGVGRPYSGPRGVFRSYCEALDALILADRLRLPDQIVHAKELLVYRVLLRDETAMADLVATVLGPLAAARGGPEPLLRTLQAYFAAGGNAAEAGRQLHLSVRAVTYRLQRVRELTGYPATDPTHQLPLRVAVIGARWLNWPQDTQDTRRPRSVGG